MGAANLDRHVAFQRRRSGSNGIDAPAVPFSRAGHSTRVNPPSADLSEDQVARRGPHLRLELSVAGVKRIAVSDLETPTECVPADFERAGVKVAGSHLRERVRRLNRNGSAGTGAIDAALAGGHSPQLSHIVQSPAVRRSVGGDSTSMTSSSCDGPKAEAACHRGGRSGAGKRTLLQLRCSAELAVRVGAPAEGSSLRIEPAGVVRSGDELHEHRRAGQLRRGGIFRSSADAELPRSSRSPTAGTGIVGMTGVTTAHRQCDGIPGAWTGAIAATAGQDSEIERG